MEHSNIDKADLFLEYINKEPSDNEKKGLDEYFAKVRRNSISKPVVFIGVTSSSVVAGALDTLKAVKEYQDENGLDFEIIEVGSIGLCKHEPIMDVQIPGKCRISFHSVSSDQVAPILDGAFNNFLSTENVLAQYRNPLHQPWTGVPFFNELPFFVGQQRLVLDNCGLISPNFIADYLAFGGYKTFANILRQHTHEEVCEIVEKSGLRGRGGGGFPTGIKWRYALEEAANQKYFICNADESDPGAFMDRLLIESNPHLIIEGVAISAYAIGASKAIVYTRSRYQIAAERLENAINQAYSKGLLGHNILDSGYSLDVVIRKGPGAYVCGEETALIKSLEGKRGMPFLKPPYPTKKGLNGMPTVVNNVETVANIPIILKHGYEWYSQIGTEKSKGTKTFSISGNVNQTCLVELPLGTPIAKLVELAGGVPKGKQLKAIHFGGPSGGCITTENLNLPIDFDVLEEKGFHMGSGGVSVFDNSVCMVDMAKYFMEFIQNESCGKCIPCRDGSKRMLGILDSITHYPSREEGRSTLERFKGVIQLEILAEVMRDTSLCGLGQTAPTPVLSILKYFREELEEHIFDRKCSSSVCKDLRSFYIDVERCTGCAVCEKKCPTNAIYGTPRSPYFIIEEKCIGCGVCEQVCKFNAVFFK